MRISRIRKAVLAKIVIPDGYTARTGIWISVYYERDHWYIVRIPLKSNEGPWLDQVKKVYYNVKTGEIK